MSSLERTTSFTNVLDDNDVVMYDDNVQPSDQPHQVVIHIDSQRCPSPVPTEPEDPDPEYISNQLASHKIKAHDFAFSTTPSIPLTPEIFDPYKALGEFELRLHQHPRTLPIPGKSLRRLLEIGWVTEDEVKERCDAEDLRGLAEFDERNQKRALALSSSGDDTERSRYRPDGSYPYLTLRYTHVPSIVEREGLVDSVRILFKTVDRVVRMAMSMERQRERDRIEGEQAEREMRRVEEERRRAQEEHETGFVEKSREEARRTVGAWVAGSGFGASSSDATAIKLPSPDGAVNSRKRSPHQAWADEDADGVYEDEDSEAKRLRLARSQSEVWYNQPSHSQSQSQSQSQYRSQTHARSLSQPQAPEKQYPAPLSAYDPELYPDAASVIESQSQSQGGRMPYYREEEMVTPPPPPSVDEGQEDQDDTRPNALKKSPKKGLKRGLTRGRTLVQIC